LAPVAAAPAPAPRAAPLPTRAREAVEADSPPVPAPAPADSPPARRAAPAPAESPPARSATPAPHPAATGTLSVNASPWGNVYVNGRLAGTTPLLRFPVRAGRAHVAVENPKLGRKVVDVRVEPKQDTPLIVDLREPPETP